MKTFTVTYRKLYWVDLITIEIEAYNFADAESKFNNEFQEEDNLFITQISINK